MSDKFDWYLTPRKWRQPITQPVCGLLMRIGLNASHITHARFFLLLLFFPAWIYGRYGLAIVLIFLNLMIDMFDGDLARMLKMDSDLGKFQDVMVDNFMVIIIPLALIWNNQINGFVGAYYIFCSTIAWWFSIIRINYKKKSDWLLNPEASILLHFVRFWGLTVLIILYAFSGIDIFLEATIILSIILTLNLLYDYRKIIKRG